MCRITYIIIGVRVIEVGVYVADDEEYFTAPSSPSKLGSSEDGDSDDDCIANMSTPDEGPDVFIQG